MTKNPGPKTDDDENVLRFTVDAGLLFQLGEELVNKRSVAMAELIKNAYDADATLVTITFENVTEPGGTITIADNGVGMRTDQIKQSWMRIATSEKQRSFTSRRFKRALAGAKGVGRFAARRLANALELRSMAKGKDGKFEETIVRFDWNAFRPGKLVQDIPIEFETASIDMPKGSVASGVTLLLEDVRDVWTPTDFAELHRDLLALITPNEVEQHEDEEDRESDEKSPGATDPGFTFKLVASEFPQYQGSATEKFLEYALGVLNGQVDEEGLASYTLKFRGAKPLSFTSPTTFPTIGSASFTVHLFVYRGEFFTSLPILMREAQSVGRENGGVRIYMDRFRVPPYGDPGDDWLRLDEDRGRRVDKVPLELERKVAGLQRPMLLLPGNNQLFGRVRLARETNQSLHQTVNRERFIENEAFHQLRGFVRLGINWMTVAYARTFASTRTKAKAQRNDPVGLITRARESFEKAATEMAQPERAQVLQAIQLAEDSIREQQDEIISELSMLRVLASTGTMIVVFDHQLVGAMATLRDSHAKMMREVGKLPARSREDLRTQLSRLEQWVADIEHQANLLGLLVSRESRSRRKRILLHKAVESVYSAFGAYSRDLGVELTNSVPSTLKTPPLFSSELTAILLNLVTNALKAVRRVKDRRVQVSADRKDSKITVAVSDTGIGASRERWEDYFKPFRGESEPDPMLGHGTGLGLKIVRDFAALYGGNAEFVEPIAPWRTTIVVTIPEG